MRNIQIFYIKDKGSDPTDLEGGSNIGNTRIIIYHDLNLSGRIILPRVLKIPLIYVIGLDFSLLSTHNYKILLKPGCYEIVFFYVHTHTYIYTYAYNIYNLNYDRLSDLLTDMKAHGKVTLQN